MSDTGSVAAVMILEPGADMVSTRLERVDVTAAGFVGDRHAGLTRKADVRAKGVPRGTEIPNTRQVSLVSAAELREVAERLGVESVEPEWLGANLCLEGIDNLTRLPRGTRLEFEGGLVLVIDEENTPCTGPGQAIEAAYPGHDGLAQRFPKAAIRRRGLVGWVAQPAAVAVNESVTVIPADVTAGG